MMLLRSIKNKIPKQSITIAKRSSSTETKDKKGNVSIPEFADVVIIGGGSAGCSALYHLAQNGVNAVLLESSKLTSGTTWHTGGLLWRLRGPTDVEIELMTDTINVYKNLEVETGENPGWVQNGGVSLAKTNARMEEFKRMSGLGKAFGIESHLLSPKETKDLVPVLDESTFVGALYCPGDGAVDPATLIQALTKSVKNNGCQIIEDCPVSRIFTKRNMFDKPEISGVETPYGVIATTSILNASGVWSKNIAKMAGVDIPLVPMKHAYVVTESSEEFQNLPNIKDHDRSTYFKIVGGTISMGGYEPNPIILSTPPKDFAFSLYDLDWDIFNTLYSGMTEIIPKLKETGIRSTVYGPESFTPDHKPIMGEDPRCSGLFYSCGYNSAGMMLGPSCGKQIAKWLVTGRPEKHMFAYDIRRFIPEQRSNSIWINERSQEAYALNYNIPYPNDQPLAGRNLKTDPFHELLLKRGAFMEEKQGWERPGFFLRNHSLPIPSYDYRGCYGIPKNPESDYERELRKELTYDFSEHHSIIREEALACRNAAALFDLSYFGKFYLCGPNAQEAVDHIFTANTNRKVDRTVYTCTLNKDGGVEADCTVTAIEAGLGGVADPILKGRGFYIVAGGASSYHTFAHISEIVKERDFNVSLHNATEQIGVLSLQGPNSRKILQSLVDEDISNNGLPFSYSKLLRVNGEQVRLFRLSFVGELGYELHIPNQACKKVYEAIVKAGKKYKMKLAGFRALYSLSCEKGYHLWGSDLRIDDNPVEAGLDFVCRKEGSYQGYEKVKKVLDNGCKRKLVHFHIQSKLPVWGMEPIYRDGEVVGHLRRGDYSFFFEKSIGQGFVSHPDGLKVSKKFLNSGNYQIEIMGEKFPATLFLHSPFDPENKRLHGVYR